MDMMDWKAARIEQVARDDMARRLNALESALRYEVEAADRMRQQMMAAINCAAVERAEHADTLAARDRTIAKQAIQVGTLRADLNAATVRADTAECMLAMATDRLKHILCCDGNLALCEWSEHAGQWLELRDGVAFGELLHQIDDDRLLTESQARDAWEARQADEIARIAERNAARRAA